MENKLMRFLSLMLALVMVLGMMPVSYADAVAAANTPVSHEGSLKSGQYLLVSANYLYRAGTPNMPTDAQTPTYRAVQAVARDNDQKLTCFNFGATLENITNEYVWTLEIVSGNNVDGYTAKIKSADGKCMTFENGKVTLVDDASVTILPGNDDCNKGESNTNGYKADDFIYTWGIKFDITDPDNRVYLNYGNPVGKWSFDNGSHWCFFPIQADAADAYRDIPTEKVSVSAGDSQSGEGPENANGGDSIWHTNWNGIVKDKLWFQFELNEGNAYMVDGLRYKPRTGSQNGVITKYDIQISYDGVYYKTVVEDGQWDYANEKNNNRTWSSVQFDPHNAKYVRLVVEESLSDSGKVFASADEFRLTGVPAYCEHSFEKEVTPATADAVGSVRYTCTKCDFVDTLEMLANAKLNNNEIIALENCEYTYTADHKLVRNGIYINLSSGSNGKTPGAVSGDSVTFEEGSNGAVYLKFASDTAYYLHFFSEQNPVGWDRCSNANAAIHSSGTHELFLFKADANSDHTDIPGYSKVPYDQISANESYLIAGKAGINWYIMVPSTSTDKLDHIAKVVPQTVTHSCTPGAPIYAKTENGYTKTVSCSVCDTVMSGEENLEKFGISYANIAMENSLEVSFAFGMSLMNEAEWKGCYAVIEHQYAGGSKTDTQKVYFAEWKPEEINKNNFYYVTFEGVAAKEMADEFRVTIYKADGTAISETYIDSIETYAMRVLNGNGSDAYKRVVVDMLNYGAEAQKAFKYNTANLANRGLSEEQKQIGDVAFDEELNKDNCPVDYKANVKLESKLQFLMAFTGINEKMSAEVTFTDWNGVEKTKTVPGEKFVDAGTFHYFTIEDLVVADGRQVITCTIYDANGKQIAQVTDSLASYAGRTTTNPELYKAIVKFSDSAKAYLESKKAN